MDEETKAAIAFVIAASAAACLTAVAVIAILGGN